MSRGKAESRALVELKTRARLRLNAMKDSQPGARGEVRLRDCLNAVSKQTGFDDFQHARCVLSGEARPGEDFGSFWYAPRCAGLLNRWFATYEDARAALKHGTARSFLLPYRRQFMLVEDGFIRELGLDPEDAAWDRAEHDAARAEGEDWFALAFRRLKAI